MSGVDVHRELGAGARLRWMKLMAVVGAMLATSLVWVVASLLGVEIQQPGFGEQGAQPLSVWWTAAVTGAVGVVAIGLLGLVERLSRRPAGGWLVLAVLLLVVSLGGPLSGTGIGADNRIALASMHLAAAAVLIPILYRTARSRGDGRNT